MSLKLLAMLLGSGVGGGGLFATGRYLIDLLVGGRQRKAQVEATEVDADSRRVQMADSIIASLQAQQAATQAQLTSMEARYREEIEQRHKVERNLYRRIARLERVIILAGLELPGDDND